MEMQKAGPTFPMTKFGTTRPLTHKIPNQGIAALQDVPGGAHQPPTLVRVAPREGKASHESAKGPEATPMVPSRLHRPGDGL